MNQRVDVDVIGLEKNLFKAPSSFTFLQETSPILSKITLGPRREKTCLRGFVNNTGADQPAHPRSLISAFVIRVLKRSIC